MIMDATGPPLRTIMCRGTETLKAKTALLSRFTLMKKEVYINHDFRGIFRSERNKERGPAESEKNEGTVKRNVMINCVKVISAPGLC